MQCVLTAFVCPFYGLLCYNLFTSNVHIYIIQLIHPREEELTSRDTNIALELFNSVGLGGKVLSRKAEKLISQCGHRTDVLKKAIELCDNPVTPKELYVVSSSYVWLGAAYRKEAIIYLRKYIAVGATYEDTPSDIINIYGYDINQKESNIANVYYNLGMCLEKEYIFNDAITAYKAASDHDKYFAHYIICVANVYVKMNDYNSAIDLLNMAKSSLYYREYEKESYDGTVTINNDFMFCIDRAITEIIAKKENGYIYRKRS